uniref:Uncharacterized protein n=1 Tax=Grammatophora oceanica TaxID=210454 RepID=A0A7S1UM71_9STRA|mmetsp:Transcript_11402/g.16728  ORF Transcript_11402/g.16728 Transcript_11402/m.16728 type:complete len:500 (+) Transcript_11402:121-1620(+)
MYRNKIERFENSKKTNHEGAAATDGAGVISNSAHLSQGTDEPTNTAVTQVSSDNEALLAAKGVSLPRRRARNTTTQNKETKPKQKTQKEVKKHANKSAVEKRKALMFLEEDHLGGRTLAEGAGGAFSKIPSDDDNGSFDWVSFSGEAIGPSELRGHSTSNGWLHPSTPGAYRIGFNEDDQGHQANVPGMVGRAPTGARSIENEPIQSSSSGRVLTSPGTIVVGDGNLASGPPDVVYDDGDRDTFVVPQAFPVLSSILPPTDAIVQQEPDYGSEDNDTAKEDTSSSSVFGRKSALAAIIVLVVIGVAVGLVVGLGGGRGPSGPTTSPTVGTTLPPSTLFWAQMGDDIFGESPGDQQGTAVALSDDGSILAIGAWTNNGTGFESGHVRVYQWIENRRWVQRGQEIDGAAAGDRFGRSAALAADGNTLAVGGTQNTESGYVQIYRWDPDTSTWIQQGQTISGDNPTGEFGLSVTLSKDGMMVASGDPFYDDPNTNGTRSGVA